MGDHSKNSSNDIPLMSNRSMTSEPIAVPQKVTPRPDNEMITSNRIGLKVDTENIGEGSDDDYNVTDRSTPGPLTQSGLLKNETKFARNNCGFLSQDNLTTTKFENVILDKNEAGRDLAKLPLYSDSGDIVEDH